MVKEYREAEQKHTGFSTLRDSEVLKALVFLVRLAHGRTSGRPKSRAFVDFLSCQFPDKQSAAVPLERQSNHPAVRIILATDVHGSNQLFYLIGANPCDPCSVCSTFPNYLVPAGNSLQQFAHRFFQLWMPCFGGDFSQRFEYETSQMHGRMRHG